MGADRAAGMRRRRFPIPRTRSNDDCLRMCVAYALNRPASKVPHFVKRYGGHWRYHLAQWLKRRRMALVQVDGEPRDFIGRGPLYIACGPTKNTKRNNWHHAVVKRHGEVVYDSAEGTPLTKVLWSFLVLRNKPVG